MSDVIDKALDLLERDEYSECFQVMAAEIERLRAALQRIADENWSPKLTEIAIRALKEKR